MSFNMDGSSIDGNCRVGVGYIARGQNEDNEIVETETDDSLGKWDFRYGDFGIWKNDQIRMAVSDLTT